MEGMVNAKVVVTRCRFRQTKGREEKEKDVRTVASILCLMMHAVIAEHVINKAMVVYMNFLLKDIWR